MYGKLNIVRIVIFLIKSLVASASLYPYLVYVVQ